MQKKNDPKYVVIAESSPAVRGDGMRIVVAGAGGRMEFCSSGAAYLEALKEVPSGTRASVCAKAKNWIKFGCRIAAKMDDDGKLTVLHRYGRGSDAFMKEIGLWESSDASK